MLASLPPQPPAIVAAAPESYMIARYKGNGGSNQRPELKFVVINGTVEKVLPDNKNGYGHQRFVFHVASGAPPELEVDVDLTYGHRVEDLKVGEKLEIKGVLYHDAPRGNRPAHDGIHWTHHRKNNGDAGYIKAPDGHIYE
jgi:hypothetical protein